MASNLRAELHLFSSLQHHAKHHDFTYCKYSKDVLRLTNCRVYFTLKYNFIVGNSSL